MRVLAFQALLCVAAVCFSACSDAPELTGTYHEQPTVSGGYPDDQWFAVGVDMFQFEAEVGGIVRYYALKDASPNSSTFDPENERFCFWLPPTRVTDSERDFQLGYDDIHWPERAESTLVFRTDDTGDSLTGFKLTNCNHPLCQGRTPDARCNEQGCLVEGEPEETDGLPGIRGTIPAAEVERTLRMTRTAAEPGNECERRPRHFVLQPRDLDRQRESEKVLQLGNASGPLWSDRGSRRFTYTVAWAGEDVATYTEFEENPDLLQPEVPQEDELPFVFDWYRRATDTPTLQRVGFDRWLPPGFWRDATRDIRVGGTQASIVVGTYFLYYEDTSNFGEAPYDARAAHWNPRTEPIVAAPFVESEEVGALEGTVVVWIEGKPSQLPPGILALFPADAGPNEGYSLWDAVINATDQPGEIIRFRTPRNGRSLVNLYVRRTFEEYEHPKHTQLSIARLPVE